MPKPGIPLTSNSQLSYADIVDVGNHSKVAIGVASTVAVAVPTDSEILRVVVDGHANIALGASDMVAATIQNYRLVAGVPERLWVGAHTHYRIIADEAAKQLWLGRIA